ncbi:hypothetical protein ACIQJT_33005 [Streptomyces sp. NPDC091972]|uniref:hypothetical protein n=1 Tax=Streptomyces sp. NPDC091972 TaxID=3366007 RepID=UPI0037FE083E
MDKSDWAMQEMKGWIGGVTVVWDGGTRVFEVYDPVRLAQTVALEIEQIGRFMARDLLVVSSVTRENIETVISAIADGGFSA